jgi:YD repeat-containing protein
MAGSAVGRANPGRPRSDSDARFGSHDAAGDRTQLTYADGGANALAVQYGYDNLGRVTTITENGSQALAGFAYDSLGRRTAISRGSGGSLASTAYAYDGVDRLSQLAQSFASSGNNLTLGIARSPSDLTSDGTRAFTYDLDNHLLTASAPTAVSLAYDPLGRVCCGIVLLPLLKNENE